MIEVREASLHAAIAKNAYVNQLANNTVKNPARRKIDMENTCAHELGGDRDGNKDRHKTDTLAERTGLLRGNQSVCG